MMHLKNFPSFGSALVAGIVVSVLTSLPASAAGVTLSIGSASAAPGSSMNSFDVDLINFGSSPIMIGGFSFNLSAFDADISLTDVSTSTQASYIFTGNSLFGPDLSGPNTGQTILGSDVVRIPSTGTTIVPGGTVGLGHVAFNVSSNALPGKFAVNAAGFPNTNLSDRVGNNLVIDTLSPGTITISAAPEPSSLSLLLLAAGGILLRRFRSPRARQSS